MTSKEKAKYLVDEYRGLAHSDFHNQTGYDEFQREENQRQCALIVVDEILKIEIIKDSIDDYYLRYWQQVKTEIKKL